MLGWHKELIAGAAIVAGSILGITRLWPGWQLVRQASRERAPSGRAQFLTIGMLLLAGTALGGLGIVALALMHRQETQSARSQEADLASARDPLAESARLAAAAPGDEYAHDTRLGENPFAETPPEAFADIEKDLEARFATDEIDPESYRHRAYLRLVRGQYSAALSDASMAVEHGGATHENLAVRAIADIATGSFERGVADLSSIIEANANSSILFYQRAMAARLTMALDPAEDDIRKALRYNATSALYLGELAQIEAARNRPAEALKIHDRAVAANPGNPGAFAARGQERMRQQQYGEAIADFTRALELSGENASYRTIRGLTYLAKGDRDKGLDDLRAACDMNHQEACDLLSRQH